MSVESDSDLPSCLNTPAKQARKAHELAEIPSGVRVEKAERRQSSSSDLSPWLSNRALAWASCWLQKSTSTASITSCAAVLQEPYLLEGLPVFVSNFDLNQLNILTDEAGERTGIVDWDLSTPLPFSLGLAQIHTIVGEYSKVEFNMPADFEEAGKRFWEEMFDGMQPEARKIIDANLDALQIALKLAVS
ncbi:MAG: hypothetical protein M1831_006546 [Alyxoria varia]|nr:MAG: hypothetical protein M1831_006546 [Alyxoria varia]